MTDDNDYAPLSVTLKAGPGYEAPWIVVRGDNTEQVSQLLRDIWKNNLGGAVIATAQTLHNEYAGGPTAKPATPTPEQAVQNVVQATDGQVVGQQATGQAAPTQGQTASAPPPSDGPTSETDKFGRVFEYNRTDAPQTAYGPKVLMRATSQAGKPYAAWLDPRDKRTPVNFRAGNRQNPVDLIDQEFARV